MFNGLAVMKLLNIERDQDKNDTLALLLRNRENNMEVAIFVEFRSGFRIHQTPVRRRHSSTILCVWSQSS
jgi:hypothetical protein